MKTDSWTLFIIVVMVMWYFDVELKHRIWPEPIVSEAKP